MFSHFHTLVGSINYILHLKATDRDRSIQGPHFTRSQ